jgi:DNA-binding response OmpR family regulator
MMPETGLSLTEFSANLVRTILVVEDEDMIRMIVTEFLQDCGYHVEEAGDVEQAKKILLDRSVDLVFSDVNMPGTETGFGLEKWVRQHFPHTKVLMTSGCPQAPSDTQDLLEPMILKPYSYTTVVNRIQQLLLEP